MNGKHFLLFRDHSSLEFALLVTKKNSFNGAERDISYISIPGKSGDLIIDNGRYKNVNIVYDLALVNNTELPFAELTHQIKGWLLSESGYFRLWDSYDQDYFRYASYNAEVGIEQELQSLGSVQLSFNCKPFKYSFSGQNVLVFKESGSLYNPEFFSSCPYIKIIGQGAVTLTVNNSAFYFTDIDEYIEIDSEIMNSYKGTVLQNNKMSGAGFPILAPGKNNISWVGNVTKLEIVPRWCCL